MRRQTARFPALTCLVLALGACEELNVDDEEHAQEEEGSGDSGGSSSGGSSSGASHGGDGNADDVDADGDTKTETDDSSKPPRVALERGGVEGAWAEDGVRKFLGIPYAKEPGGELRWSAPQMPDKWSDDLKATKFARACPQLGESLPSGDDHLEDCLYLNVWAPGHNPKKALPVLVWFHGGDHQQGSAAERGDGEAHFDGTALARENVVVVTINYRLGPLGFLPLGEAPAPKSTREEGWNAALYGNQGLWDQAFALRWVQDNIEVFGGDPDNVTIFGQGSGAVDVCMHVASPVSGGKKLFQQAISQSGGCTTYQRTSSQVLDGASAWLEKLDCNNKANADDVTKCLRGKSVRDLFAAIPDPAAASKWFSPSVDGTFMPEQPRALFDDGNIANVPYLLGTNANEGSELLTGLTVDAEEDYHAALAKLFPSATDVERCEVYPHDAYASAKKPYRLALSHVLGDGASTCAVLDTAQRARDADSDVYAYWFAGPEADDASAGHGAEIKYVFGAGEFSDGEAKLRDLMQRYWTSFAADGYPDGGEGTPDWPEFGAKRKVLSLGKDVTVLTDLRKAQCALWSDVYDAEFKARDLTDAPKAEPKND